MDWWQFSLLGTCGGAIVEVLSVFRWLAVWQDARRTTTGRVKSSPPRARSFVDAPVHAWMLLVRMLLGAGTASLFGATGQISGAYVAVALGFAAPSALAQLGSVPQLASIIAKPSNLSAVNIDISPRQKPKTGISDAP